MSSEVKKYAALLRSGEYIDLVGHGLWTPTSEDPIDQHQRRPYALLVQEKEAACPPPRIITSQSLGETAMILEEARDRVRLEPEIMWPDMDRLVQSMRNARVGDQSPVSRLVLGTLRNIVLARPVWLERHPDRADETAEDEKTNLVKYAAEKLRLLAATGYNTIDLVRTYQHLSGKSAEELAYFLTLLPENPFLRGGARLDARRGLHVAFSGSTQQIDNQFLERLEGKPLSPIDEALVTPPNYPYKEILNGPHEEVVEVEDGKNRVVIN